MIMSSKQRVYGKIFCPHCNRDVSKSTWYSHYGKYFDSSSNTWTKSLPAQTSVHSVEEESDFDFETASDVEMEEYSNRQMV